MSEDIILKQRQQLGHPTFNRGINYLYRYYKHKPGFESLTKNEIKRILSKQRAYAFHKPQRKRKLYNPTYVYTIRQLVQLDLVEIRYWGKVDLSRKNGGVRFLSVAIDVFSRFAIVLPVTRKTAENVLEAIKQTETLFRRSRPDVEVERYFFDQGKEYRLCQQYFDSKNVKYSHSYSERKASVVERFLLTLQRSIYQYMTHHDTFKYLDVLQKIVDSYNSAKHSYFGNELSPLEAERPENRELVQLHHSLKYMKVEKKAKKMVPEFSLGDLVRIKKKGTKLGHRGYHFQFSSEVYKIEKLNRNLPVITYNVQDILTGKVYGRYYANELVLVDYKEVFVVKKILRSRLNPDTNTTQHLVRFQDLKDPVWVDSDNLTDSD